DGPQREVPQQGNDLRFEVLAGAQLAVDARGQRRPVAHPAAGARDLDERAVEDDLPRDAPGRLKIDRGVADPLHTAAARRQARKARRAGIEERLDVVAGDGVAATGTQDPAAAERRGVLETEGLRVDGA